MNTPEIIVPELDSYAESSSSCGNGAKEHTRIHPNVYAPALL